MPNAIARPPTHWQEKLALPFAHASVAATTTVKIYKTALRALRLDRVTYDNPTGFAQDPANYWTVSIQSGATILAQWSTQTAQQGTLAADTFVDFKNSATDANLVVAAATTLTLVLTKTGAPASIPVGSLVIEARYI